MTKDIKIGFVSVDVDYHSSATSCLSVLEYGTSCYMPAVPMYFDDFMTDCLTANSWCGEALAIREFNEAPALRKIEPNPFFDTANRWRPYHACHILDHPLRSGKMKLRNGFHLIHCSFY